MVGSCGACTSCGKGREQYCTKGCTFTYNSKLPDGRLTFGGYSSDMVCHESFVLRIPDALPLDAAAPLLCAGITVYSPLVAHGFTKPGTKLGVLGMGGLGSMAVRIASAFGCEVTVISSSPGKKEEALRLGAKHFWVSSDEEAVKAAQGSLDAIIDTVSADHSLDNALGLLGTDGKLVLVGVPSQPLKIGAFSLIGGARSVAGSLIGGVKETQECLDFCAKHGIVSAIELIQADYVNTAFERLVKNDVKGRFVIDCSTI